MADPEPGDVYLRRLAAFIRTHEKNLAAAGVVRRRRSQKPDPVAVYNPLSWFADSNEPAPLVLSVDTHHLFYTLMRLEALGLDIGTLDVRIDNPSRPMSFLVSLYIVCAVSGLSLGGGWWGRPEPPSLDSELKYLFSSFTKLPALTLTAPTKKVIAELVDQPPNENALPLDAFRNLQSLECVDIDPRTLLGWDRLAESLRSLKIKKSGLEDVSDIFIGAVIDDQARRAGSTSRKRRRRIPNGASRPPSVYATRLPDSVPEEEPEQPENGSSSPPPPTELSSLKWAFLKHLSLSDNSLTFFPSPCVQCLTSLTHLDLSSNLLVSVPPNLAALYNLVSLNLSDNMIDSVLNIYQHLGGVVYVNLAHNRLESLCGLERLPALERVDLRNNLVDESAEVGRLAMLPNIAEIWIDGNPFVEIEENYRITCFDFFWKEGKTISLDGSQPGFYEKRNLTVPPPSQMSSSRPVSAAYSPPIVAVGHAHAHGTASPPASTDPASTAPTTSHETSPNMGPVGAVGVTGKGRRKAKRIVDLDGGDSDGAGSTRRPSHTRTKSEGSSRAKARPKGKKTDANADPTPILSKDWGHFGTLAEEASDVAAPLKISTNNIDTGAAPRRSRHTRYQSEMTLHVSPGAESTSTSPPVMTPSGTPTTATFRRQRNSATFSAKRSERRARVSASVYEPVTSTSDGEGGGGCGRQRGCLPAADRGIEKGHGGRLA
ncbi:Leucine rich repeat domain protein [Mycena sanguinolenta]|uniref:Leucine rich repeat domain protein n=1 Tax=Mycena sanguinolenta TaxID=230812 RepID=A0A8H6ZE85_9AGAR|nr:Leucine rich repeat domain protein [Mycena sanguinolenta]